MTRPTYTRVIGTTVFARQNPDAAQGPRACLRCGIEVHALRRDGLGVCADCFRDKTWLRLALGYEGTPRKSSLVGKRPAPGECMRGHRIVGANVMLRKNGNPRCRLCHTVANRVRWARGHGVELDERIVLADELARTDERGAAIAAAATGRAE